MFINVGKMQKGEKELFTGERQRRKLYRRCSVEDNPRELAILRGLHKLNNLKMLVNSIRSTAQYNDHLLDEPAGAACKGTSEGHFAQPIQS
jgi:hypothetical protein